MYEWRDLFREIRPIGVIRIKKYTSKLQIIKPS